jgi:hypothetical protein
MSVRELVLYKPHLVQRAMHESSARFRVGCWGRQAGKSTWGANEIAKQAWDVERTNHWFIEPSFDQARVQYRRFLEEFPPLCGIHRKKPNDSEHRIFLQTGSDVAYKSGLVLHRLRGETLHTVAVDEMRDQPPELWTQVLNPMLTTTGGRASFISTPRGFDQFYDIAQIAQTDTTGDWEFFHAPSTCNPLFTQSEFERLKREMSEAEFAQEILAEFRDLNRGSAYRSFSPSNQSLVSPLVRAPIDTPAVSGPSLQSLINPYLPIHLACDFNVGYMGWVLSQFRNGIGHYAFDEIWLERSHTEEAIDLFVQKLQQYEAEMGPLRADPKVILIGDATGEAGKTSAGGKTDYTIIESALKKAGITFRNLTPTANPRVKDRVNTVNTRLKSADGTINAWIHPKRCPNLKKDLERVTWKENAQGAILDQNTDPSRTHSSDAWGYDICVTNPIDAVKDVGALRILRR